jgi:hypothetical protein
MSRIKSLSLVLAFTASLDLAGHAAYGAPIAFGMPAYWRYSPAAYDNRIPKGAYVVINPASGIVNPKTRQLSISSSELQSWRAVIATIHSQGAKVLGYVPTGYAQLDQEAMDRYMAIGANLREYKNLGGVDGIFFDEAVYEDENSKRNSISETSKCQNTPNKWNKIRATPNVSSFQPLVWNAGYTGENDCFVGAAKRGEHVVLFEKSSAEYKAEFGSLNSNAQKKADSLGVKTWVLVYAATQSDMKAVMNSTTANYIYVTNNAKTTTLWDTTPGYWGTDSTTGTERWCLKTRMAGGTC